MRFGVVVLPTDPWAEAAERARRVEVLGYDHLWTYDHLSWRGYRGRPWFAAIPWLTGIAGVTRRIGLGTMVTTPNLRNPATLAQAAVTLDHVSAGRLVLGVGAGGVGFDSTVFGASPLSPPELRARFEEWVTLLDRLLREPTVSHDGTYYSVSEAVVRPASVRQPRLPIAIAAGGRGTIAVAARLGDAWIQYADPTTAPMADAVARARARVQVFEDACDENDRDPSTVRRILMLGTAPEPVLASAAALGDLAGRYGELGFTDFVFHHPHTADPTRREPEEILDDIATLIEPA